jgi:hypothetical protein
VDKPVVLFFVFACCFVSPNYFHCSRSITLSRPLSLSLVDVAKPLHHACDSLQHSQVICDFCDTSENIATCHMSHATCLKNLQFFAMCPLKMA